MKPVIIDVVGSHSVGKTTAIQYLTSVFQSICSEHTKIKEIPSTSRTKLMEKGLKIYDTVTDFSQSFISMSNWAHILKSAKLNDITMCTDFVVRSFGYTLASNSTSDDSVFLHKQWQEILCELVPFVSDIFWIYIPVEFPVVPDGVRSLDEKYRLEVDRQILHVLNSCKLNYITLSGSLIERNYKLKEFANQISAFQSMRGV